jgi:hypothetical protein
MSVLMAGVMDVPVGVFQNLVHVHVHMPFGEMKSRSDDHE